MVSLTISVVKGSFAEARLQHSPWDANQMAVKICCSSCFAASLIVRRSRRNLSEDSSKKDSVEPMVLYVMRREYMLFRQALVWPGSSGT